VTCLEGNRLVAPFRVLLGEVDVEFIGSFPNHSKSCIFQF